MGARFPAAHCGDSHLLPVARVAPNGRIDTSLVERNIALDQGDIAFDDGVPFHLLYQYRVSARVPGHDHQPGGILIQAMHDPRSRIRANALQVRQVCQQRVDQRIIMVPRSRMHDHPRRFIHHQYILVLVDDVER